MAGFSDFYTGSMAPPDRLNGTLVPSTPYGQPTSLAQIYAGIIPSAPAPRVDGIGEGLTALGGWNQFDDQFNSPVEVHPTAVASGSAPHMGATVNAASPLDISRLGLTTDPFRPQTSAQQAIAQQTSLASMFGGTHMAGPALFGYGSPGVTDWSVANPGDGGLYGRPATGIFSGDNSGTPPTRRAAPAPVAPPPTPVQSLAAQFTPAAQPPLMSGDLYGANRGFGGENAQMPDSMNNSRWRDGY
jgi:hypothetical protein